MTGRPTGNRGGAAVRIQVLGPVRVWRDGREMDVGPLAQRALFGLLTVAGGQPVSRTEITATLWPDQQPPRSATNVIQTYVKRLRLLLEPQRPRRGPGGVLATAGDGYLVDVPADGVDVARFRNLATTAGALGRAGDQLRAAEVFASALGLWHGAPLADVPTLSTHPRVVALARERRAALLRYGDAMLAVGAATDVLTAVADAAAAQPLDEAVLALLIRTHQAAGQRAVAFEAYHDARRRLADELGVGPGPELTAVHADLLRDTIPAPTRALDTIRQPTTRACRFGCPCWAF